MDQETYEQIELPKEFVGDRAAFLQDGMKVTLEMYEDTPLGMRMPQQRHPRPSSRPIRW